MRVFGKEKKVQYDISSLGRQRRSYGPLAAVANWPRVVSKSIKGILAYFTLSLNLCLHESWRTGAKALAHSVFHARLRGGAWKEQIVCDWKHVSKLFVPVMVCVFHTNCSFDQDKLPLLTPKLPGDFLSLVCL